jgi:hypothetical protein
MAEGEDRKGKEMENNSEYIWAKAPKLTRAQE